MQTIPLKSKVVDVEEDPEAIFEDFYARGWTDGLPVIPPTPARVERMIAAGGRPANEVVAILEPRNAPATVEKIAINAVMAGCHPSYFPVLLTIVECMPHPGVDPLGMNTTTNPVWLMSVVNGPVRQKLNINSGYGVLGPGWRANATIGRATRLIQLNTAGSIPAEVTKSCQAHPGRYGQCVGEFEERSPWEPLHVERGFKKEESAVTLVAPMSAIRITETDCKTAEGLLHFIAGCMDSPTTAGHPDTHSLLMLCPDHAAILAREGLSKKDVKQELYKRTKAIPLSRWPSELTTGDLKRLGVVGHRPADQGGTTCVHASPDNFKVIVAGGPSGYHSTWFSLWFHGAEIPTRRIQLPS